MIRYCILLGFTAMFYLIRASGNLNKYINTKYAYLSTSAIIMLSLLCAFEFWRMYRKEKGTAGQIQEHHHEPVHDHVHKEDHDHSHDHDHGHSHAPSSRLNRTFSTLILCLPIVTGIFLPVQTLDSSFVKAKGFSFPGLDVSTSNPGQHQFLKPDTSVFYGPDNYETVKHQEESEFVKRNPIVLNDKEFLKGMEALYNFPGDFMGKTVAFDGFAYKGEQADSNHFFVFRFGFLHCAADSGVFGMLVDFPKGVTLKDDDWVHVTGELTNEFYQPFKQTIPVLKVRSWTAVSTPKDPYVYRVY
jgi:putative membrane protein